MLNDALVLVLLVLLVWLGFKVHDSVMSLASVPRGVGEAGDAIQHGFESAGDAVGDAPVVGGPLSDALRDAGGGTGGRLAQSAREGEEDVKHLAVLLGLLVFGLPALAVLARYVPERVED